MSSIKLSFKSDYQKIKETLNNNYSSDFEKEKNQNSKNIFSILEVSTKSSISKRKSKLSIFSGDSKFINNSSSNRFDAFGNEINKKGNKNYQISFIDEISSQKIAEVILIDNSYSYCKNGKNKVKENCKCSTCFIF